MVGEIIIGNRVYFKYYSVIICTYFFVLFDEKGQKGAKIDFLGKNVDSNILC